MDHVWTQEEQLAALMRLPWTLNVETDIDGSLVVQVGEIHDAIGTGKDVKELARDLWESLRASLDIRLENGDDIPLPRGYALLPWEPGFAEPNQDEEIFLAQPAGPLSLQFRATAA